MLKMVHFMLCVFTTIFFKKQGNSDACYNMDGLWRYYVKWNKPDTEGQILYESPFMRYLE